MIHINEVTASDFPLEPGELVKVKGEWFFYHIENNGSFDRPSILNQGSDKVHAFMTTRLPPGTLIVYEETRGHLFNIRDYKDRYKRLVFYWPEKELHIMVSCVIGDQDRHFREIIEKPTSTSCI